jgi:uncharacterized membrane protein YphA (DoxX/SURF4 family)
MLPAVPVPDVDLGLPLLVSLGLTLVKPLLGLSSHTALLLYAVATDQTRLQPEVVSLTFLLWGTVSHPAATLLARVHLVSMWIFAGANKLLSPPFLNGSSQWMMSGLIPTADSFVLQYAGYFIATAELSVGLLAVWPRTRLLAAGLAFGLHVAILKVLSPWGHNWNESVWPWNVALALSGLFYIAPWKESLWRSLASCHRLALAAALVVLLGPIGFYLGMVDAYHAHHLYTSNTPQTLWCTGSGACVRGRESLETFRAFHVPLPPEHRLFEAYFNQACQSGDRLTISDPRTVADLLGGNTRTILCAK